MRYVLVTNEAAARYKFNTRGHKQPKQGGVILSEKEVDFNPNLQHLPDLASKVEALGGTMHTQMEALLME